MTARRTAIGTAGHAFATLTTTDLAAPLLREAQVLTSPLGLPVDDVVLGNCLGAGGDIARVAGLSAGLGTDVPGVTVDRQCGSGLDAVLQAASRLRAGHGELIFAGGVESASTAPWRSWPPIGDALPVRYTRAPFTPDGFPDPDMGAGADALARHLGLSRTRQDEYAARSHARAAASTDDGTFDDEVLMVQGVARDERPRTGMTTARLSRLRPTFDDQGTVTAGNACGISDGAAVLAITTAEHARRAGMSAIRIRGAAVAGADPAMPGLAIEAAVRKLWRRAEVAEIGVRIGDVGAVEITEAFAAVALAAIDGLGLDPGQVCSQGGAIGLGHPWGASGAVLLVRLVARMRAPDGPEFGLAACAIGGGQGIAMLLQQGPA